MLLLVLAAAAIGLPGVDGPLDLDDLLFARSLQMLVVPGARSRTLFLVGADGKIDRISFPPASGDGGITSADEGGGLLFATDRSSRTLYVVDPEKREVVGSSALAAGPDYVRYAAGEVWVTEPRAEQIEVFRLDGRTPRRAGFVKVPGGPESLVVDAQRKRAWTNLWKSSTVELNLAAHSLARTLPNGCEGSRGIDLDVMRGRVFVGCKEGKAVVLDGSSGKVVMSRTLEVDGVDIVAFDGERLFVPGARTGNMAIARVGADGSLALERRVETAEGAHCVAVDGHGGAYVCDPRHGRILHVEPPAK